MPASALRIMHARATVAEARDPLWVGGCSAMMPPVSDNSGSAGILSDRPRSCRGRWRPARDAHSETLITGEGGTPTPCTMAVVIIRPQAEVEDEDQLPVAFPARGSLDLFEIADLTSEATGFDGDL